MEKYKTRNDVPEKYKWDLTDFFSSKEDFNESFEELKNKIKVLKEFKGCTKDKKRLLKYLDYYIDCERLFENLYIYSFLLDDQELGISENVERTNKVLNLANEIEVNTSFFIPELLNLSENEYNELFNEEILSEYKAYLDEIYKNKNHVLSEKEEIIISELTNSMNHFDSISSTMLNSEHNYGSIKIENEKEIIATNNYRRLMKTKDVNVRKKVYHSFNKKLDEYSKTNAGLLNSFVSMNNTISKLRNFNSCWEHKLFNLDLSNKVFESLINACENNIDRLQKYYKLKKKVLGLDNLYQYDMNLEMCESDKFYSIEDAQKMLLEIIKPLGEDYINHFKKIFDERYIDYCQYKGKASGAYSASSRDKNSRILMSFNYDLDSISTIAHEGGHNVHNQYLKENNLIHYNRVSTIIAEVASLTNECLLSFYLADNGEDKIEKLAGLENIIRVFVSNFYGAVREGKMEQDMYSKVQNGGTLTKDFMDNLTIDSLKKYYGGTVKIDKYCKNSWINRSHYYNFFYLYSYAISIAVALTISNKILNYDKDFINKYIEFLSAGSESSIVDIFKIIDVDIENENVYIEAIEQFSLLLEKYDKIYFDEEV